MKLATMKVTCVKDLEEVASRKLPRNAWDYYRSGADTEFTLLDNENAFQRYRFRPRVLRDVTVIDTTTTLLGTTVTSPVCIAPTAMQRLASLRGELDTARAASSKGDFLSAYELEPTPPAGTVMALSMLSTTSLEDVAHEFNNLSVSHGGLWFQVYIYKDREVTKQLIKRAEAAGYQCLCVTVDAPYMGKRRADTRNKFAMPPGMKFAHFNSGMAGGAAKTDSWLLEYSQSLFDASLQWEDLSWLKSITKLKIVLKGIVTAEDAELGVHHGVDGILVSNHGARQLDGAPATIDALQEVVNSVQGRCEVYLDGGIRTGSDVAKALAMGARAVFIGRPVLWGLAHNGATGVEEVLSILTKELRSTMGLLGATKIGELTPAMVALRFSAML